MCSISAKTLNHCLDFPKYCDFNKFFLVEELALEQDYRNLHYGKCSLIGKLGENKNGDLELENIQLPNLACQYSLFEGSVSIRLLNFHNHGWIRPQYGRFCEISGEVVLLDVLNPSSNHNPLTARGVREQLDRLAGDHKRKEEFHSTLLQTHKPAVRLFYLREIDRAGELAERSLEIRMLSTR